MNQSIFIAGNNPSSCLVCAYRTLLWAQPGVLVLNVGTVPLNISEGGRTKRGSKRKNQK
jgi:hypothetical protein